ncbi:thioredoxin-like protein [Rhexocercosporidium sp. MPI-PUGE-AT-0058]|nr:thioredoxin-like protein [Rhexocercosporidium sp. MPI-PUGE-AT-0058]
MFRFHKTKDVITLFHKASSPASMRVNTLLKQVSANASEHATEDQASDHSTASKPNRPEFDVDVTEEPPTQDQLKSILEYVGVQKASTIIKGAKDEADAMKKLKENSESFQRPVTVDWSNGRAVVGANESEILKMIESLPK